MEASKLEKKAASQGLTDAEMAQLEYESNIKRRDLLEKKAELDDNEINELESLYSSIADADYEVNPTGPVEAFSKTAVDELLLGHYPQAAAAVKSLGSDRPYVKLRDQEIERLKRLEMEEPTAALAGKVSGIGASMLVPAMGSAKILKGAGLGQKALLGAAEGLGYVAGQNPGDIEGQVNPVQLEQRMDTILDNPYSSGIAAALPVIGPVAKAFRGEDVAAKAAYSAIGPKKKAFIESYTAKPDPLTKQPSPKSQEAIGRFALDEGIIKPITTYEKMFLRANEKLQTVGQEIGGIVKANKGALDTFFEKQGMKGKDLNNYFSRTLSESAKPGILAEIREKLKFERGADAAADSIDNYMEQFLPKGLGTTLEIEELQKLRGSLNDTIKWSKREKELPAIQKGLKIFREKVDDAMNNEFDLMEKATGSTDKQRIRKLRAEYGKAQTIADSALDRFAQGETAQVNPQTGVFGGAMVGGMLKQSVPGALAGAALGGAAALAHNAGAKGRYGSGYANFLESMQEVGRVPIGGARVTSALIPQAEPKLQGFPTSQTQPVDFTQYADIKRDIENDPTMTKVEKANRLNLLNKYSRIYIGQ